MYLLTLEKKLITQQKLLKTPIVKKLQVTEKENSIIF